MAALFYSYEFLLRVAPTVMVEDFRHTFLLNGSGVGFLLSCYSFAYTPTQLPGGALIDYYGPRKLLLLAVILCCVGSFLIPFSVNLYVTQISLFIIGFGSAFAFVGVLKLAINWLPHKHFAFFSGLTTMLGMLGAIFGQRIMSYVISKHDWLYAWTLSGKIGIILFILMFLFIHDSPKNKNIKKLPKKHLNIVSSVKEFLMLMKGNRQFLLNGIIGGLLFLPISVFGSSWGIEFLRYVYTLKSEYAANSVPFIFAGLTLGGPLAGLLCGKYRRSKIFLQISALSLCILFLILIFANYSSYHVLQLLLFLIGFFVGPQVLVFHRSILLSSSKLAGSAAASTNFIVMIPSILYPIIIGILLDLFSTKNAQSGLHQFTSLEFQLVMTIIPISLLAACFLLKFVSEEKFIKEVKLID